MPEWEYRPRELAVGMLVKHFRTGKPVLIIDGQYESNGRISNHFSWRPVLKDGTLGETKSGYGWSNPTLIPHELKVIIKKKRRVQHG